MVAEQFIEGILSLADPLIMAILIASVLFGIMIGAMPGVGPVVGMTVVLPLTLILESLTAVISLVAIYAGAMYGGAIPAILMNTPGTAAAAASTIDGYPMAKQGNAKSALSLSVMSSSIGGFVTTLLVIIMAIGLVDVILLFASPHYFLIAMLGLALIVVITAGNILRGVIAGAFGILITTIGLSPATGDVRFTFGHLFLYDGVSFVAGLIGIFAIGEMLRLVKEEKIADEDLDLSGSRFECLDIIRNNPILVAKSSLIGMGLGLIPGAGASISTFVSYSEAERSSEDSNFGDGDPRGLLSAEAANNSTVGGSLIPTLAFGVPGSGSTAVLLGGLLLHGIRPGPDLFSSNLDVTFALLSSLLIANVIILIVGLTYITKLSYVTNINIDMIVPIIIILGFLGTFEIRTNWLDVISLPLFAIIGYLMRKYDYSIIAFVLGLVLGPIAEENLHRSILLSDGMFTIFYSDPLALGLLISTVLVLLYPTLPQISKIYSRHL